jgi:preprotein translocase subunit SecE
MPPIGDEKQMNEVSQVAYRYAALFYGIIAAYFWYIFYSLWGFLGKNYLPQDVSSVFSIQNSNFHIVSIAIATVLTLAVTVGLILHSKLKEFIVDVGDELSRVAWPTFKEAQKTTAIVIALVIVSSIVLFFADTVFLRVINLVMGTAA